MWYAAQGCGIVAMIAAVASFQGNSKKYMLLVQMAASTMFMLHYGLLYFCGEESLTGAILNLVNIAKCIVYCFSLDKKNKWANIKIWSPVFTAVNIVASILTWTVWYSALPLLAIIFTTLAFIPKSPRNVRLFYLPSSPCWLIYNILTGAWPAFATECFNLVSLTVAFIRFDILGQKEKTGNNTEG